MVTDKDGIMAPEQAYALRYCQPDASPETRWMRGHAAAARARPSNAAAPATGCLCPASRASAVPEQQHDFPSDFNFAVTSRACMFTNFPGTPAVRVSCTKVLKLRGKD